ncbi:FUSC family protein [Stenotrophomonas aracearum]|uniref:FUSC family protein n=1 Tax=Stenotrophomonas aracearum TaxID=3003272 RepID=A0ABY9YCX9_9GAMM|nr:FUSC family protein [Stenotrophomonas sp. A5588]WNH48732.1 FUSC family protein [Stenotrophomonas sp. A5588]
MLLLDRQAWLFSVKTFLAALAALYIGLAGNLSRPYWAMATVYIVTQPMLGPTRAKGVYRIVGTLIAGAATLWMLPHLVETPLLLSAAMSLWLSACLFIALLNRGPRGYAFLLAGYTTAFIGFPAVTSPDTIFDTVVARSEEIILGTVVAVLFASLFFPSSARPMLRARIGSWMGDAAQWCRQILLRGQAHGPRNRLAADLVQFEALIEFLRRDDPRHAGSAVSMERLRERMLLMLPVLSSIADRLGALRAGGRALPPGLEPLVQDIAQWLEHPGRASSAEHDALRARILALKPAVDGELDHLLLVTLLLRLEELVDLWQDCATLQDAIEHGSAPRDTAHYRVRAERIGDARHVDYGMALFSAASAGVALMTYCALWIGLGWEGGGNGAMMAAVAAAFFAAQDDPAPSMLQFLLWAIVASGVAAVYLFGVFPAVHDFGSLALVLAVIFLPLGLLLHRPKTALIGLPLTVNLVALLNVQNTYNANIQSFINSSVAMFIGIGFAVVMTRVFRSVGAEWTARRLVRQGWVTLAEAAEGHGQQDRQRFAARMLDLLGLLAPRLAATPEGSDIASVDMLTEARIGLNILQLRRARHGLPAASMQAIETILDDVAAHYRAQVAQRRPLPAPPALQARLEASLQRVQTVEAGKARDEALMGVLGLRYALFPEQLAVTQGGVS